MNFESMNPEKYWAIYDEAFNLLGLHDLSKADKFMDDVIHRVDEDADPDEWNTDDVRIAIRNALNELIEKFNNS